MEKSYKSKIDWWVWALLIVVFAACSIGPVMDGSGVVSSIILAVGISSLWIACITGVKYEIRGNQLGVRNLYQWTWMPIDKITEVKKNRGIISTAGLSFDRLAIKFSDRSVLKSSAPLQISPKDRDAFIAALKEINPAIVSE